MQVVHQEQMQDVSRIKNVLNQYQAMMFKAIVWLVLNFQQIPCNQFDNHIKVSRSDMEFSAASKC